MFRLLVLMLALVAVGCRSREGSTVKRVSLAELEAETKHLVFFNYTGSDAQFHYFTTKEGKRYKLDRSAWQLPMAFPPDSGMQLFVTVKDGKVTVPDPKTMGSLPESELLPPEE
jgi:hypothetical protein